MGLTVGRPGLSTHHYISECSNMGHRKSTYVRVSAHLEVLHGRVGIALPGESRKVARHQLQSLKIASIT